MGEIERLGKTMVKKSSIQIAMEVLRAISIEHEQLLKENGRYETAAAYNARMLVKEYFRDAQSVVPVPG